MQGEQASKAEVQALKRRLIDKDAQMLANTERLTQLEALHRMAQVHTLHLRLVLSVMVLCLDSAVGSVIHVRGCGLRLSCSVDVSAAGDPVTGCIQRQVPCRMKAHQHCCLRHISGHSSNTWAVKVP